MRRVLLPVAVALTVLVAAATATGPDARGWSEGQAAANAAKVLAPLPDDARVPLPSSLDKVLKKKRTLLVYFSPTCPHCIAVAPELIALNNTLKKHKAQVVGVATGQSTQEQIDTFVSELGVDFKIVHDTSGEIAQAMQARSTPSALLVEPKAKDAEDVRIIDAFYPYVRGHDALVEMRLNPGNPFAAFRPGEYQGNATCSACHTQEMDSWMVSFHAVAWKTLAQRNEHENGECNTCHVTGAGQPSGWDGDLHSPLVDVGCEACHGPGGPHDGSATEPQSTCEGCHDADHSIAFSYEKGLPLIDHFQANALTEQEWMTRRRALWDGELPKDLLAFPEGKVVGPEACESCHSEEVSHWRTTAHASAMNSLAPKPVDASVLTEAGPTLSTAESAGAIDHTGDVACVTCHASPSEMGSMKPTSVEGFRTADHVGCESCHGSAEAHVAAGGGTDNIQGLGESCPVCVLEAMCTSCHTPKWDKEWDLDTRLKAVSHGGKAR